jgi:6-phosphogluconate dehydrogenase
MKEERVKMSESYVIPPVRFTGDKKAFTEKIKKALYASKIISYAQGFSLMKKASETYGWNLNYGEIALLWRGGCIIRSAFLGKIKEAYDNEPTLFDTLSAPFFRSKHIKAQEAWREVCAAAIMNGVPVPAISSALGYFDGLRSARLPANLLQAQRDYFGAHRCERVDGKRGEFWHTEWKGTN